MKKSLGLVLLSSLLSLSINVAVAAESKLELLAGVEAGSNAGTSMTTTDLSKTQKILSSLMKGAVDSWYNIDSTTHFDVKIGEHYSLNLRPCIAYEVTTKHDSKTENQNLNACKNYEGQWIALDSTLSM
jgi:surface antigen